MFMVVLLLTLVNDASAVYEDKFLTKLIYKYIYANERQCGDPFSDPAWLPAVGECAIECPQTEFMCLLNTKTRLQKCSKLPMECVNGIRDSLGWSRLEPRMRTTFPPPTVITKSKRNKKVNKGGNHSLSSAIGVDQKGSKTHLPKNVIPGFRVYNEEFEVLDRTKTDEKWLSVSPENATVDDKLERLGGNENNIDALKEKDRESKPPGTDEYNNLPSFVIDNDPYDDYSVENFYGAEADETSSKSFVKSSTADPDISQRGGYPDPHVESTSTPVPPVAFLTESPLEINDINSNIHGRNEIPMMPSLQPPYYPTGMRIDLVPPPPPRDPVEQHQKDVISLSNGKNEFQNPETVTNTTHGKHASRWDSSSRCCEWALQGLCDSHWQKVRKICPKSCGKLFCEEIEGLKSCSRVINVDVLDCFESSRRLFGLRNYLRTSERRIKLNGFTDLGVRPIRKLKKKHRL